MNNPVKLIEKLLSPNGGYEFLNILLRSRYTGILLSQNEIDISSESRINGSQLMFISFKTLTLDTMSVIDTRGRGCSYNSGRGHGPAFKATNIIC